MWWSGSGYPFRGRDEARPLTDPWLGGRECWRSVWRGHGVSSMETLVEQTCEGSGIERRSPRDS